MDLSSLHIEVILSASLNVLVLAAFAYDKLKAKANSWRTPKNIHLLLAALGPFGALTAMMGFRHKTCNLKFFVMPVFAILHLLVFIWLWPHVIG